jgi:hypothetical protein
VGKVVWVDMDADHGLYFSPRKGIIVAVSGRGAEKEDVVVELVPPPFLFTPIPRRATHILLRYSSKSVDDIHRTFRIGDSYAEVLQIRKSAEVLRTKSVVEKDCSHVGYASIFPWPSSYSLKKSAE